MKLEKMLKTLFLSSALLLSLAAAAGAAETLPATDAAPAAVTPAAVTATDTPAANCDRAAAPLYQSAVEKGTESLAPTCGSCSSSSCNGATRGQMCWTGGVHGQWGRCNIYTGNTCSTGGWECTCGTGPIP